MPPPEPGLRREEEENGRSGRQGAHGDPPPGGLVGRDPRLPHDGGEADDGRDRSRLPEGQGPSPATWETWPSAENIRPKPSPRGARRSRPRRRDVVAR